MCCIPKSVAIRGPRLPSISGRFPPVLLTAPSPSLNEGKPWSNGGFRTIQAEFVALTSRWASRREGRPASDDALVAFGTDAPWLAPSESIRQEMRLLEEAGLSLVQILRAATRSAAEHIGRSHDLGTTMNPLVRADENIGVCRERRAEGA